MKINTSLLQYLQLQPVDPQDDGSVSDLDAYQHDETIDLNSDVDDQALEHAWQQVLDDYKSDPDKINFSEE